MSANNVSLGSKLEVKGYSRIVENSFGIVQGSKCFRYCNVILLSNLAVFLQSPDCLVTNNLSGISDSTDSFKKIKYDFFSLIESPKVV